MPIANLLSAWLLLISQSRWTRLSIEVHLHGGQAYAETNGNNNELKANAVMKEAPTEAAPSEEQGQSTKSSVWRQQSRDSGKKKLSLSRSEGVV